MFTSIIGWLASAILIVTLLWQVWTQAKTHSDKGVSRWLFAGQISASVLFLLYSLRVHNGVFVVSNAVILLTAIAGQWVFHRNKARQGRS
ncbi:hypothetical protein [Rhodanobacter sp. L36]|uniref:hypothetical protein n=1 Tax=Rhodanobacter sp. L36 TaxID=1747221 RepID=UPI001576CE8F|nr:hypothetical protein [Rhodanobacter sp. L36]